MFREFHILLDSPPNNIFTYEDTVSGKVVLESPRDEAVGWIHVFFHGWVNTEVILQNYNTQTSGGPNQSKYKDKEVLFQYYQNVYRGQENLPKKTRHEWSFQFAVEPESYDGSSLPSSGKYHNSSVEYKVIAVQGRIGQSEEHIMSMMNPDDPRFLKDAPFSPTGVFLWAGKHVGAVAEEKLEFIQMRPPGVIDPSLSPPLFGRHEISSSHLPEIQLAAPPEKHGLFHSQHQEHIPFLVNLQVAKSITEGSAFLVLLSISSTTIAWNHRPPLVTLVGFKMHLLAKTIERAGLQASEQSHKQLIFEDKDLQIPLGQEQVDISQLIPLILAGNDIIPSFNTRLLQRKYDLSAEVTVKVGGKTFHTPFLLENSIIIISKLVASGRPRAYFPALMQEPAALSGEPTTLKLKQGHIGRLTQDGSGPVRAESVIEAAVTLSKLLTIAAVRHSFPGGSLVKFHAYKLDSRHVNNTNWDQATDREKLVQMLTQTDQFRVLPSQNVIDLKLGFFDALHGENISLEFPLSSQHASDKFQDDYAKETRGPTDAVKLDPVSLFNYRLWCAATREKFGEAEMEDFGLLERAFSLEFHSHRKHIDTHMAMLAVERCPSLRPTLKSIGVEIYPDIEASFMQKGQPESQVHMDRGHDDGPGLLQGFKRNFLHRNHQKDLE